MNMTETLSPRLREVLAMRRAGYTLEQVAAHFGACRARARQWYEHALALESELKERDGACDHGEKEKS